MAPDSSATPQHPPTPGSGQPPAGYPPQQASAAEASESAAQAPAGASGAQRVLVVDPHATLRTVLAQRLRQDGH
ncbi:MAG: hypothetical protein ACKO1V_10750, partial [Cyanobium sp.]